MQDNQLKLVNFMKKYQYPVKSIVEIGARDCSETVGFAKTYRNAKIYAFEWNPQTLPLCRKQVKPYKNITLIEKAVSNKNGKVSFFAIDPKKTVTTWKDGNPGASSLFQASGKYPVEQYAQKKISVQSVRMDSFVRKNGISSIDLLWMDIQGAELMALKSFGDFISNIKIIHTEVEFFEIYKKQPLFKQIKRWLHKNNFVLAGFTYKSEYSADAVFLHSSIASSFQKIRYKLLFYEKFNI